MKLLFLYIKRLWKNLTYVDANDNMLELSISNNKWLTSNQGNIWADSTLDLWEFEAKRMVFDKSDFRHRLGKRFLGHQTSHSSKVSEKKEFDENKFRTGKQVWKLKK